MSNDLKNDKNGISLWNSLFSLLKNLSLASLTLKNVFLLFTATSFLSLVFYSLGYAFLYGYYFSGKSSPSLLELLINPVPFNFKTVITISAAFFFAVIILLLSGRFVISQWFKYWTNKSWPAFGHLAVNVITLLLYLVLFHFALTLFFVNNDLDLITNALNFAKIWFVPLLITLGIAWVLITFKNGPISSFSGIIYGAVIAATIPNYIYVDIELYGFLSQFIVILVALAFSLFEPYAKHDARLSPLLRFIYFFPLSAIIFFVISYLLSQIFKDIVFSFPVRIAILVLVLIAIFLFNFWITRINPLKILDYNSEKGTMFGEWAKNVNPSILPAMILIVVFISSAFIPKSMLLTGQHIRNYSIPKNEHQIVYESPLALEDLARLLGKDTMLIKGTIVAEKNDTYYISNDHYNLVIIKTNKIISID